MIISIPALGRLAFTCIYCLGHSEHSVNARLVYDLVFIETSFVFPILSLKNGMNVSYYPFLEKHY